MNSGMKTYVATVAIGVIGIAVAQGWLTPELANTLWWGAGSLLGVGVTHKFVKATAPKP